VSFTSRIAVTATILVSGCVVGAARSMASAESAAQLATAEAAADPQLITLPSITIPKPTFTIPKPPITIVTIPKPTFTIVTIPKPTFTIVTIPKPTFTIVTIPKPTTTTTTTAPTAPEPTQPAAPPPTSTVPPFDLGAAPQCVYRKDLVVATADLSAQAGELGLAEPTADDVANLDDSALAAMHEAHLFPYVVADGTDPLRLAATLGEQGVVAAPVSLVIPAGNWSYSSANPPTDLGSPAPTVDGGLDSPKQIAVIDTGFNAGAGDPDWMKLRIKPATGLDGDETSEAMRGHGKFVATVIAQQRPNSQITVAGVTPVALDEFVGDAKRPSPSVLTDGSDELQLWLAMRRLVGTTVAFDALNVSVGSYACPLATSGLVTQAAMIEWYSVSGGKPASAAVGNHLADEPGPYPPFLPAQMPRAFAKLTEPAFEPTLCAAPVTCTPGALYDVQSVDSAGSRSAFSNEGHFSAIGEGLVGVRKDDGTATGWSGSSFAAAVVAAAIADGSQLGDGSIVALQGVATMT
jgi:mucin-2